MFGHIPARELAWIDVDHPRRFVREGQQIETMVTGEDDVLGVLVLSRRLCLNPWPSIIETYPVGTTHSGRISQIKSYGEIPLKLSRAWSAWPTRARSHGRRI